MAFEFADTVATKERKAMAEDLEYQASIDGFRMVHVKVAKDQYLAVYKMVVTVPASSIRDVNRLIALVRNGCFVTMSESQTGLPLGG